MGEGGVIRGDLAEGLGGIRRDGRGIAWEWQSADGTNVEASLARESVESNPTDRGKNGSKRPALVDAHGVPLSLIVSGANNTHESKKIGELL
jgi:hypothetical protein